MSLTVVITRDVDDRYRGFLSSTMLEAAPCVYVSSSLNARSRDTVWKVIADWHAILQRGSITLLYPSPKEDGGIAIRNLGTPDRRAIRIDGTLLMLKG